MLFDSRTGFCGLSRQVNPNMTVHKYKYLPHGLLSMAVPRGLPQAYGFEKRNIDLINHLFKKNKK